LIEVGQSFGDRRVLTEQDLDLAVLLTDGRHPVHTDDAIARQLGFKGRIFHGAVTAAVMTSSIGRRFSDAIISIAEQACAYRLPVYPGDALVSHWTVERIESGRRPEQRWLYLVGTMQNQDGKLVAEGSAKVLLRGPLVSDSK